MKKTLLYLLCMVLTVSMLATTAFAEAGLSNFQKTNTYTKDKYSDVKSTDWFRDNVASAYEYGLMQGKNSTVFGSNDKIKLSEVIALASRLNSIYNTGKAEFSQSSPWYQSYVDYAITNGLITKNRFENYDEYATRNQFAEILASALPDSALKVINNINVGDIPDVTLDAPYDHIYKLYRAGIISGKNKYGQFVPGAYISRSECATIISRMANENLRIKFSIEPSSGNQTSPNTDLLSTINNARQLIVLALEDYNQSQSAYATCNAIIINAGDSADVQAQKQYQKSTLLLTATTMQTQSAELLLNAAKYAQDALALSKNNAKFKTAYDDINTSYSLCVEASKNISTLSASSTDLNWNYTKTIIVGTSDAIYRAQQIVLKIG